MPFFNHVSKTHFKSSCMHVADREVEMTLFRRFKHWSIYIAKPEYLDENTLDFFLFDNKPVWKNMRRQIGFIQLEKTNRHGYEVVNVGIDRKYHGHSIGFKLYKTLLLSGISIVSGESQSPGARALWVRLLADKQICGGVIRPKGWKFFPVVVLDDEIVSDIPVYDCENMIVMEAV